MRGFVVHESEPTTSCLGRNVYHMNISLFVLDCVRLFQDHPKYTRGLKENHIVEMLQKDPIVCGDIEAQVKMALKELTTYGYVRYINQGYHTLGPFAKLGLARTPRQFNIAWDRLSELQRYSCTSLSNASSS